MSMMYVECKLRESEQPEFTAAHSVLLDNQSTGKVVKLSVLNTFEYCLFVGENIFSRFLKSD